MSLRINLRPAMQELREVEQTASYLNPLSASTMQQLRRLALPSPQLSDSAISFSQLRPKHYELIKQKIENILDRNLVTDAYRERLVEPFYRVLEEKGQDWFKDQLEDKDSPIRNIVYAILQNFEENSKGKIPRANTEALREVISDLYQNFLKKSCELELCRFTPSPVPNWYEEDLSTYSRPNAIRDFGIKVAIVNVPSRYAFKATLSWGCLGHEVAGHDILGAYPGALDQLKARVVDVLKKRGLSNLTSYWEQWLEEGTADVLGSLEYGTRCSFFSDWIFKSSK